MLESRVLAPLHKLQLTFQGPTRLIQKRQDKHLDYSASMQKAEKNKDPAKAKAVRNFPTIKILLTRFFSLSFFFF